MPVKKLTMNTRVDQMTSQTLSFQVYHNTLQPSICFESMREGNDGQVFEEGSQSDRNFDINVAKRDPMVQALSQLRVSAKLNEEWFDMLDIIDTYDCDRDELNEMIASAPDDFTKGMLYGKLTLRIHNSVRCGTDFSIVNSSKAIQKKIKDIDHQINVLSHNYDEWFTEFENVDPDFCSRDELEDMMLSAPVALLQGILFGKMSMRLQIQPALFGEVFSLDQNLNFPTTSVYC